MIKPSKYWQTCDLSAFIQNEPAMPTATPLDAGTTVTRKAVKQDFIPTEENVSAADIAEIVKAIKQCEGYREALEAVLLFYSASGWTRESQDKWEQLTGKREANTRVLCDHIRSVLAVE